MMGHNYMHNFVFVELGRPGELHVCKTGIVIILLTEGVEWGPGAKDPISGRKATRQWQR